MCLKMLPWSTDLQPPSLIAVITDGGCRSVDHGSILKDTYFVLGVDRSRSKLIHTESQSQRNTVTGILRRPHNYLCFVHVCTQLGCNRYTIVRRRSANIGPDRGRVEPPCTATGIAIAIAIAIGIHFKFMASGYKTSKPVTNNASNK